MYKMRVTRLYCLARQGINIKLSLAFFYFTSVLTPHFVHGWFEFCGKTSITTVSNRDCPFGVLFRSPQEITNCLYPSSGNHLSNFCTGDDNPENEKRIQFIDAGADDADGPSSTNYATDSCKDPTGENPDEKCMLDYSPITGDIGGGGAGGGGAGGGGEVEENYSAENGNDSLNFDVRNQTFRLFLFMNDLLDDENEEIPNIRLVTLLKQSFQVLQTHCSTKYVSLDFTSEILRAFLYLLRESDLKNVRDISVSQYARIKKVLDICLNGPHPPKPFWLEGNVCSYKSQIVGIKKTVTVENGGLRNKTFPYKKDHLSFKWGKYDVPVDAAWGIMDFTHGLCYGMFNLDVNSHHLYENALERLFQIPEIIYRWSRPPKINEDYYWNHVFRAHVNSTLRSLDACIQASYIESPFLHRLIRPMVKQQIDDNTMYHRRKREVDDSRSVWCFKSQEEKDEAMLSLKGKLCS